MLDPDAEVPARLEHPRFVATPLTTAVAALDHAAYMASPDVIRAHSDGRWPVDGFTLADDLELIAEHQADHQSRRAFAFVLLTLARTEALGCLYLNSLDECLQRAGARPDVLDSLPSRSAMVTFWLRQDQQDTGLADAVAAGVNRWLLDDWPLSTHLFRVLPGERSSRTALERLNLRPVRLELPGEKPPYLWYHPV